jgi:uroporphyrinogen-III decarboxylase
MAPCKIHKAYLRRVKIRRGARDLPDQTFRDKIRGLVREAQILEGEQRQRIEEARARLDAAWNHERADKLPVTVDVDPIWSDWYYRRRYGVRIGELWENPKLLVECELRTWIDSFKEFEDDRTSVIPDAVGPLGGVFLHPSIVGSRTVFPDDDFPWIDLSQRVFDSEEEVDDFAPPEIPSAGLMPQVLEKVEMLREELEGIIEVRILGGDGSPLQMAAYTRGIVQLTRDMYTDPPLVHKLMKKLMGAYDRINRYYEAVWDVPYRGADIEGRFYDNPLSYFSSRLVERFVLPYYRGYAEECGWRHWSFETQDVMDQFIELFKAIPVRTIHSLVSSSNLKMFKEALRPKGTRFGVFMAPGRLLLDRTGLEGEVKGVIGLMGREGGWTLSSGLIDSAVPQENIHAFIAAARKYG